MGKQLIASRSRLKSDRLLWEELMSKAKNAYAEEGLDGVEELLLEALEEAELERDYMSKVTNWSTRNGRNLRVIQTLLSGGT